MLYNYICNNTTIIYHINSICDTPYTSNVIDVRYNTYLEVWSVENRFISLKEIFFIYSGDLGAFCQGEGANAN